ncbi:Bug family tripartite tricarboxylate transporter substrate binding protein [Roseococcus sp. YIM B11640]|uniref:Bug family tripartite tricarboxylate transporter substrate binding protein n=1 Tax=Roseococcus sp. YIM B11640 TaxID=3133973 RepID=UPI003C7BAB85
MHSSRELLGRRSLLGLGATLGLAAPALAQPAWPQRPLRLVVGFQPGGAIDLVARRLGALIEPALGQPVLIENVSGAGGAIAALAVKRAAPDGYTLNLATTASHAVGPLLNPGIGYDPPRDFSLVATLSNFGMALITPPSGARTLEELVATGRAHPGSIAYASAGQGTGHQIAFELLSRQAGFQASHVPYRGMAPAMPDFIAGRISAAFCDVPTALQFLNSTPLNVLAVTKREREPAFPQAPTLHELGYRCYEVTWQALVAPRGTPAAVIERLSTAVVAALRTSAGRDALESLNLNIEARAGSPDDPFLADLLEEWRGWVQQAGIRPE